MNIALHQTLYRPFPCRVIYLNAGVSVATLRTGAASLGLSEVLWSIATNRTYIGGIIGKSFLWPDNCNMKEV